MKKEGKSFYFTFFRNKFTRMHPRKLHEIYLRNASLAMLTKF